MMRLFGLIGFPLAHSFSRQYFTEKFGNENLPDCRYENFPIPAITEIREVLQQNPALEGLNVTIPYKEAIIPYLAWGSDVVKKTGACNCIKITDGKLYGFNTDVIGFAETFLSFLQQHHTKALILGTGGAAKAVRYVLDENKIPYRNVSRTAGLSALSYASLDEKLIREYNIIINTTPLGTYPKVDECPPIPYEFLTRDHYLYDLVYNPAQTVFLQKGMEKGAQVKNGAGMLKIQAEESWKIWNQPLAL